MSRLWLTKAGVLVEERDREVRDGVVKIAAYRKVTGGFHGWLRVESLTRKRAKKRRHP